MAARHIVWFFLALLLALMPAILCARDTGRAKDHVAIEAAANAWLDAYHARDLEKLMGLYEPDVVVALNNQPALKGKAAVRAYFAKAFASGSSTRMMFRIEDIQTHGTTAHLVSLYRLDLQNAGHSSSLLGRSLLIYKKGRDMRWRILADIDNATPDATPETVHP